MYMIGKCVVGHVLYIGSFYLEDLVNDMVWY